MPSANKTDTIQLNQWQSNEYPKMDDFNSDNLNIDNKFKEVGASLSDVAHKTGTVQANLNADMLDGQHGSYYAPLASPNFTGTPKINSNSIVTATVPTEFGITGLNGFVSIFGSKATYSKTQEGIVNVSCFISSGTAVSGTGINIFNLPVGYRPNTAVRTVGLANYTPIPVLIGSSGVVTVDTTISNIQNILFNISFEGVN